MKIHNKLANTKGFISLWERMILFRDMITPRAEKRVEILTFFEKHGLLATKDAYKVSKPTIYRWVKTFRENERKIQSLVPKSTAPKNKRQRIIPQEVKNLIIQERKMEKIGKEKLAKLLKNDDIANLSDSTVGRMLGDMKKKGMLPNPVKFSLSGKTGRMIERKLKKPKKKLRSKDHEGGLVKADTVVRFTDGLKRYILTAIDLESEFAFAYAYPSHASSHATDFMKTFKEVAPISLTHVQTDNGSEFQDHFELYLKSEDITHFHTYPRCPKQNAEVERFNRTLSEAFIQPNRHLLAHNLPEFNRRLMDWLIWYNTRRPHWSLGLISPLRYIVNKLPTRESQMCWTSTF